MMNHRVLILGGTTESRELAGHLSAKRNIEVVLSLAGRTRDPIGYPVPLRIGGFGGPGGLAEYIDERKIDLLIDATHPFAAQMSRHAALAALETGVEFFAVSRPAWRQTEGDRWIEAGSVADAVYKLGANTRRVFVTLGRQELAPLSGAPHHSYIVRSVDPIDPPLAVPDARYIQARGPFALAEERTLLAGEKIDVVLAKNSGGAATYAKIVAARELGVEVVLIRRPERQDVETVETVRDAVSLAHQRLASVA
ncbi:cobalt-precorrin-6A reductase [Mesorhizobium sp. BAC0120]|uniref:cobalt-precorrin-6A reductase n=1 Tax=Mesorhizobium sp. BAC0120 TaxID=3090670 RepID=UPI00298BE54D|nr:cobalt-precorrin-6A reductase [Mesorhizobium sp. BAC0120]